ncbi:MAG: methyltransferase domain-containing protein, partial [Solirubrobacteraceae bacterium]
LTQLARLKRFFSLRELLAQMSRMKRARAPLRGYLTTVCFWSLEESGVLPRLADGQRASLEELAAPGRLDPRILGFVCQYLRRLGYLDGDAQAVALSPAGQRFWRDCGPVLELFRGYQPLFDALPAELRGEARFGENLFRREASVARAFSELGRSFIFPVMAQILEQEGVRRMIELGCAEAELCRFVCERTPGFRCLGIDASASVVAAARARVATEGLADRIEVVQGDIFRIDVVPGDLESYPAVTAIDLFHGFLLDGEKGVVEMFRGLRARFPSQLLLISEICLPTEARMRAIAYPNVEHELFHGLSHQQSFAPGQLESLLADGGWRVERTWQINQLAGRVFALAR